MADDGTVRKVADGYELRYERFFNHPIERVWAAITEPAQLSQWIGQTDVELKPGGRIRIDEAGGVGIDGEILEVEPPRVLSYMWDSSEWQGGPVRWELSSQGAGTRLVFTHIHPLPPFEEFKFKTLGLARTAGAARPGAGRPSRGVDDGALAGASRPL